jgi:tetratricopeptide (TPR) repeat protein
VRLVLVLVLVLGLGSRTARADDPKLAERLFHAGERAYKSQDFFAAASDFEQAYKAFPLPEIAFSAAQAYRRQYQVDAKPSHVARAIELYRAYLDKIRTGGRVADAADGLADMQRELDRLIKAGIKVSAELAAEHTQLGVNVILSDAATTSSAVHEVEDAPGLATPALKLTIDGAPIAPFTPTNVTPGPHEIHVEAAGYDPQDRDEPVAQGAFRMVDVTLQAKPAHLSVATTARIVIDGRDAGAAPSAVSVAAGKHLVALLHDGREPWAEELVLARGEDRALHPDLAITAKRRWTTRVAIAGGVTAVVALAAASVALIEDSRASTLHDRLMTPGDQAPSVGQAYNDDLKWRDRAIDALWLFGAVTVAAGTTTAVLYYTDKPSIAVAGHF